METNQLILLSIYITTIRNLDASRLACLFNDDCFGAERQFAGPLVTKLIYSFAFHTTKSTLMAQPYYYTGNLYILIY